MTIVVHSPDLAVVVVELKQTNAYLSSIAAALAEIAENTKPELVPSGVRVDVTPATKLAHP